MLPVETEAEKDILNVQTITMLEVDALDLRAIDQRAVCRPKIWSTTSMGAQGSRRRPGHDDGSSRSHPPRSRRSRHDPRRVLA